jgi:hypothetical protein
MVSLVLKVIVAAPNDLRSERRAFRETVEEWNAQHACVESIVLCP